MDGPATKATAEGRAVGVAMLVLASVLWSISGVVVKVVQIDSVAFAFWRSLAAGVAMALVVPFVKGRWPAPGWMAASAVVYTAVVALLISAMTYSTAATGILLQYTGPVFCALFAWWFQGRRITRRTGIAMAIAALGIAVMIVGGGLERSLVGPICGLLSGAAFGGLILILEKIDRVGRGEVSPLGIVMFNNLGSALILWPLAVVLGGGVMVEGWQLGMVWGTGVVQLAIPYVLFQLALRRVRAVEASLLILLEPVLNPVWVALATSERPDWGTVVGGAAILVAMGIEALKPPADPSQAG